MKAVHAIQLTVLLVTLVVVTSAQDQGKTPAQKFDKNAYIVGELGALLDYVASQPDQLTEKQKVELEVIRELKDALQAQSVTKRSVEEFELNELVRRKRFIPALINAVVQIVNTAIIIADG